MLNFLLKYIWHNDIRNLKKSLDENPNIITTNGADLLCEALKKNNPEVINYILEKGVDLNSSNKNDENPLEIAATILCDQNITKSLLKKGANPYIIVDGKPLLYTMMPQCNKDIKNIMLDYFTLQHITLSVLKTSNITIEDKEFPPFFKNYLSYQDNTEVLTPTTGDCLDLSDD